MSQKSTKISTADLLYAGLAVTVLAIGGIVLLSGGGSVSDSARAQSDPNSPGGGALALPTPSNSTEDDKEEEEERPTTATDVPVPETPQVEPEIIDDEGESIPNDEGFELENDIDTTEPIAIDRQSGEVIDQNPPQPKTVRSGGVAFWLTVIGLTAAGGGIWYYQSHGNRKSKFKMTEK